MREVDVFVSDGRGYLGKPHWLVDKKTGCWVWQRSRDKLGYGRVGRSVYGEYLAHRAVFQLYKGDIPKGLCLDHLCRNPSCVNPDHLEPVTQAVNNFRGLRILTDERVREIRLSAEPHETIARRLGVGLNTVVACRSGRSYGILAPDENLARETRQHYRPRRLDAKQVRAIRASADTKRALSERYGVSTGLIQMVRNHRAYADVT